MLNHQLQHSRQLGCWIHINKFSIHNIRNGPVHEIVIARHHTDWCKGKAFEKVELRYDANNIAILDDRISIEIISFEALLQLIHHDILSHSLHRASHMARNNFFKKLVQETLQSVAFHVYSISKYASEPLIICPLSGRNDLIKVKQKACFFRQNDIGFKNDAGAARLIPNVPSSFGRGLCHKFWIIHI
jgi:hypothetical protein